MLYFSLQKYINLAMEYIMKKILSLFLAFLLLLSIAGCRIAPAPETQQPDTGLFAETTLPQQTTAPETTAPETTEAPTEPETTEAPTEPDTTARPTEPPAATQKPTEPPATQTPTDPPATTEKPTDPPAVTEKPTSQSQQIVDQAFALAQGQKLSGTVTLTGKVTSVTEVSSSYGNATFKIQVEGSDGKKTILCYRVTPTGTIQNYKGTVEFYPATYTNLSYDGTQSTTPPTTSGGTSSGSIDKNGVYDSKDEVALYIHTYGCLPSNYITKSQAKAQGYPSDKCCGGDRFYNKEGLLPEKSGRVYYECDIDTLGRGSNRGTKRIVFSNDGLIYYTSNHYASFTLLYGTP